MISLELNPIEMKKLLFYALALFSVILCGPKKQKQDNLSMKELTKEALTTLSDSTSSWQQVVRYVEPFVDSLVDAATDEDDLSRRMTGQKLGYAFMDMMIDKYSDLQSANKDVSKSEMNSIVESLKGAICCWFFDDSSEAPHLWRDHYYVSNKAAESPIDGYFHLMVTVPTKENPEPELHIFYPEMAEDMPLIIFKDNEDEDVTEKDFDAKNIIVLKDWISKKENEDGFPMYALAGADVINKMLTNEVMYLVFRSAKTPSGDLGETEIARVNLFPFQVLWQETVSE